MSFEESPDWDGMPEAKPLMVLSWEDVYEKANDVTRSKFNREPTRDEVTTIFDNINRTDIDYENSTFWATVEENVSAFYSDVTE